MNAPNSILPDLFESTSVAVDEQLARIQRLGRQLFKSANCIIAFGEVYAQTPTDTRAATSVELAFCHEMMRRPELRAILDASTDPELSQHRYVRGTPHIRFFVSCPIRNAEGDVIGSVNILDYQPRNFGDEERGMLADLASLVEREMQLRLVSETQIELLRKNKSLRRRSLLDPLIGTWNRGAITRILSIEASRCIKLGQPLSVIVLDLDHFKHINDTYGHPAGDQVLIAVAGRLRACIRPQEALGRFGGEEFLVVLPGAGVVTALAVAERMREAIAARPESVEGHTLALTISAGLASTEVHSRCTKEELVKLADEALYRAKTGGRNRVVASRADSAHRDGAAGT